MQRQPQRRCRAKGAQEGICASGPEGSNRQGGARTASRTDPWLWQQRVRAQQSQAERSLRRADRAGWGRFLATLLRLVEVAEQAEVNGVQLTAAADGVGGEVLPKGLPLLA